MKLINEIIDHLKYAIEDITLGNIDKNSINLNSNLIEELGIDSLDYAQIMLSGEEYIGCKINENDIDWKSIKTIIQLAEVLYKSQI